MSAPTPSTYAALRTEAIAAQVTNPGFRLDDYVLMALFVLTLTICGVTA